MTRLWIAFVLGWLLVPVVSAGFLVASGAPAPRLVLEVLAVLAIAALYLWLTLRDSLRPSDLDPEGPAAPQLRRRLMLLSAMSVLVIALAALDPGTETWWIAQNVVVAAGLALPVVLAAWLIGGVTALTLLGTWYLTGRPALVALILLAFGASAVAVRLLTVAVAQLRAAREELARTAVDQERLRFARDLHDLLGHTLSLIVLKSELAGQLLPALPARAAAEIADVERSARDALQQVRTTVAGYRQPVLARELDAAREILAAASITGVIEDAASPLPAELDGLFAWSVREGVVNVIRHSRARRCEIRVYRNGHRAELSVTDDGRGSHSGAPRAGSGLAGVAERVRAGGAVMAAEALPEGGFRLVVTASLADWPGDGAG